MLSVRYSTGIGTHLAILNKLFNSEESETTEKRNIENDDLFDDLFDSRAILGKIIESA